MPTWSGFVYVAFAERTHEAIDDLTLIEVEDLYYAHHTALAETG